MNKKVFISIASFALCAVALLVVGFFAGSALTSQKYESFLGSISLQREANASYPLVHPILGLNSNNSLVINQFGPLAKRIQDIFTVNKLNVKRYSVYFRDQNKGFWVGINEDYTFSPASMLKVALAMATYKQAEKDPAFLDEYKIYTPILAKINTDLSSSLPSELKVNQSYKIEDLISKMIVDSDNGAKDILGNTVDPDVMNDVYNYLGIDIPKDGQSYLISAKKYVGFFRSLYSATYLNQDYSNRLLTLLSHTDFNKGLVAGIPNTVTVSHKYGEFVSGDDTTINNLELHDCGIVYLPSNPYLLCVMTQGKDESELENIIAGVSKVVYDEVNNNYK